MRKIFYPILASVALTIGLAACNSDDDNTMDNWDKYEDWREQNVAYYNEQKALTNADGTPYYEVLNPSWDQGAEILIHWFNDREKTKDNLSPLVTSTVLCGYKGWTKNGTAFDSSYTALTRTTLFTVGKVISGWQTALLNMHAGDSVRVVLPYGQAYGATGSGATILPYSTLTFDIQLADIPYYEIRP